MICIKNPFPGSLTLRATKQHIGVSLWFLIFSFWFVFPIENSDWFTQFLVFFPSYKVVLSHLLKYELHFGDQDAVILCLHKIGQRAELNYPILSKPSPPKYYHLIPESPRDTIYPWKSLVWYFSFFHMETMPLPSLPLVIDPFSSVLVFAREGTGWLHGTCISSSPNFLWASAGLWSQLLSGCCVEDAQVPNTQSRVIRKDWEMSVFLARACQAAGLGSKHHA